MSVWGARISEIASQRNRGSHAECGGRWSSLLPRRSNVVHRDGGGVACAGVLVVPHCGAEGVDVRGRACRIVISELTGGRKSSGPRSQRKG